MVEAVGISLGLLVLFVSFYLYEYFSNNGYRDFSFCGEILSFFSIIASLIVVAVLSYGLAVFLVPLLILAYNKVKEYRDG